MSYIWGTRKFNLINTNTYKHINPYNILFNGHEMKAYRNIKIPGCITYQVNTSEELHDSIAIFVKSHIKHKLDTNYLRDFMDIKV